MANITIVKSGNSIIVDFGDYALLNNVDGRKASYKVEDISVIWIEKDDSFVTVKMKDAVTNNNWKLSFDSTPNSFIVDSIDAIAPTDNSDLFDKLTALR
jgi:hypothetical protein